MAETSFGPLPLEWVRAFEAAGRTGSFTAAAAETGLTQSAISQRIGHLERRLGTRLFERQARGVILTVDGESWLPYTTSALRTLQQSADDLFGGPRRRITVSSTASVIELWLAPRLVSRPKGLEVSFKTSVLNADTRAAASRDIQIIYGDGNWPERWKAPMFDEAITPVAAPALLETSKDWRTLPRIALTGARPGWSSWCATTGDPATPVPGLRFDGFSSAMAAARAGLGVLLASIPLSARDLADGSLVRLSDQTLSPRNTYWMIAADGTVSARQWNAMVTQFVEGGR